MKNLRTKRRCRILNFRPSGTMSARCSVRHDIRLLDLPLARQWRTLLRTILLPNSPCTTIDLKQMCVLICWLDAQRWRKIWKCARVANLGHVPSPRASSCPRIANFRHVPSPCASSCPHDYLRRFLCGLDCLLNLFPGFASFESFPFRSRDLGTRSLRS